MTLSTTNIHKENGIICASISDFFGKIENVGPERKAFTARS
jgi:hypothetical protein